MSGSEGQQAIAAVIPVYNCEAFVADAVESALAQTVAPAEVIVVDDGSTDGTVAALSGVRSRIRLVSQQNRGLSCARNVGARAANAAWLAFLDADDTWLPDKLERQLAEARDPRVALVYTDRYNVGDRGTLPEVQGHALELYAGDVFVDLLVQGNNVTASSALVRADVFRKLGGFAEHLRAAEDWDLWVRIAESYLVAVCRSPLVRYRYHGAMMSRDPARMCNARRQVVERALASPRGRTLDRRTRRRVLASVALSNARTASVSGNASVALSAYRDAISATPLNRAVYAEFLRFVLRRHS